MKKKLNATWTSEPSLKEILSATVKRDCKLRYSFVWAFICLLILMVLSVPFLLTYLDRRLSR